MSLADVAHSRAGDKGTTVNLSLIAYAPEDYPWLASLVTADRVREHLAGVVHGAVVRYELPHLGAFNFVFSRRQGQSVTRTLGLDPHGKALSSMLLSMPIPDEQQRNRQGEAPCGHDDRR